MKGKNLSVLLLIGGLSACIITLPTTSSKIVETNAEKGDLYSITSQHCRLQCNDFLMDQAQKICEGGYTIQDRQVLAGGTTMLIRCTKK